MARKKLLWWAGGIIFAVALVLFTIFVAAPNVVTAGQKATERMAVATLRTVLWAQDEMIELKGRAGLVAELSGARKVDGEVLPAPLLRGQFRELRSNPTGQSASFSGFEYAVHVFDAQGTATDGGRAPAPGAKTWVAYAWPTERGTSAVAAFCINGREEILTTPNISQGYDGLKAAPKPRACPLGPNGELSPGVGGDGGEWTWWRGQRTRRARAAQQDDQSP